MQAEKLQNEEREKKKILKPQIDLIKENFNHMDSREKIMIFNGQ